MFITYYSHKQIYIDILAIRIFIGTKTKQSLTVSNRLIMTLFKTAFGNFYLKTLRKQRLFSKKQTA